jgi:uncharacterized YigZ family protein
MLDQYQSIQSLSQAIFTDRGSKFYAFAWPVKDETHIKQHLDHLRKEHFKARHHCFAWRLGTDGQLFRSNDDGEPSGTAGRPILAQIDALQVTDVLVVVVRYFGGTLLGTSGLINAYRTVAHDALSQAAKVTYYLMDTYHFELTYGILPTFMELLRKTEAQILEETYTGQNYAVKIEVKKQNATEMLDKLKAGLHGLPSTEALGLSWPEDVVFKKA